jgi:hypothetical protein
MIVLSNVAIDCLDEFFDRSEASTADGQSPANTQIGDCLTHNGFRFRSLMIDIVHAGTFSVVLNFIPHASEKGEAIIFRALKEELRFSVRTLK